MTTTPRTMSAEMEERIRSLIAQSVERTFAADLLAELDAEREAHQVQRASLAGALGKTEGELDALAKAALALVTNLVQRHDHAGGAANVAAVVTALEKLNGLTLLNPGTP